MIFTLFQCEVGSEVTVKVGGDFHHDVTDPTNQNKDVLLIGGGVGINPLLSIMTEIADNKLQNNVTLLYSAKTQEEMIFQVILVSLGALSLSRENFPMCNNSDE